MRSFHLHLNIISRLRRLLGNPYAHRLVIASGFISMVLFSVLTTGFQFTPRASAWSGDLGTCADYNIDDWDWPKMLKVDGGHPANSFKEPYPDFSLENDSYLIFKDATQNAITGSDHDMTMLYTRDKTKPLIITESGGAHGVQASDSANAPMYKVTFDMGLSHAPSDTAYTWLNTISGTITNARTDVACILYANKIQYSNLYTGATYNTKGEAGNQPVCQSTDLVCKLGQIFDGIGDTFQAVGMAIVAGISWLFLPDVDAISSFAGEVGDSITDTFGFLLYPFEFFNNVYGAISTEFTTCTETDCTRNFGDFMGSDMSFDIAEMHSRWPTMWTIVTTIVRMSLVLLVFGLFYRKYQEMITK